MYFGETLPDAGYMADTRGIHRMMRDSSSGQRSLYWPPMMFSTVDHASMIIAIDASSKKPADNAGRVMVRARAACTAMRTHRRSAAPGETRWAVVRRATTQRGSGSGHQAAGIRQRAAQRRRAANIAPLLQVTVADVENVAEGWREYGLVYKLIKII